MLLGIFACNENQYEAVSTEKQLKPDRETISKLITGFDKATKRILSSHSALSDAQMGELYLNEVARLGINIERHASQSDENFAAETDYTPAFIDFVSQMATAPAFDSIEVKIYELLRGWGTYRRVRWLYLNN